MSKGSNQKLRLMYLSEIMKRETDDMHRLTAAQIIGMLHTDYSIELERKTFYEDIEALQHLGLDIISEKSGRSTYYYLASRDFELAELKLLVDTVQSSKFITESKSAGLIKKLERFASRYEANELHRQVILTGRVKTPNEKIYYTVDTLHKAINGNKQITFVYCMWSAEKKLILRHNGALYHVSPWALILDDENYYLIGYDHAEDKIKHYRVDKMLDLKINDASREGRGKFEEYDLPSYTKSLFGMFGGEKMTDVTLICENSCAGILFDRFGTDIAVIPCDDTHFRTHVRIIPSNQFLGWIFALGGRIRIVAPDSLIDKMRQNIANCAGQYQKSDPMI